MLPGGAELRLVQRGADFSITLHNNELMSSRLGRVGAARSRIWPSIG